MDLKRDADLRPNPFLVADVEHVNDAYLRRGRLNVEILGRGTAWLDTGTHQSLHEATAYVSILEQRQGLKIACPEEIAWRMGYITADQLRVLGEGLASSSYGQYLLALLAPGA